MSPVASNMHQQLDQTFASDPQLQILQMHHIQQRANAPQSYNSLIPTAHEMYNLQDPAAPQAHLAMVPPTNQHNSTPSGLISYDIPLDSIQQFSLPQSTPWHQFACPSCGSAACRCMKCPPTMQTLNSGGQWSQACGRKSHTERPLQMQPELQMQAHHSITPQQQAQSEPQLVLHEPTIDPQMINEFDDFIEYEPTLEVSGSSIASGLPSWYSDAKCCH